MLDETDAREIIVRRCHYVAITYVVYFTTIIGIGVSASNPGEASEGLLCDSADGIRSRILLIDLRFTRGDVEP